METISNKKTEQAFLADSTQAIPLNYNTTSRTVKHCFGGFSFGQSHDKLSPPLKTPTPSLYPLSAFSALLKRVGRTQVHQRDRGVVRYWGTCQIARVGVREVAGWRLPRLTPWHRADTSSLKIANQRGSYRLPLACGGDQDFSSKGSPSSYSLLLEQVTYLRFSSQKILPVS